MARFDGKNNKQVCTSLKLSELSGVTVPAHTGADVTLFKTGDPKVMLKSAMTAIFSNAMMEANARDETRAALEPLFEEKWRADCALYESNDEAMELGDVERIKQNMKDYANHLLAVAVAIGDNTTMSKAYAFEHDGVKKLPIDNKEQASDAAAALSPGGFRGNKVEGIPDDMMAGVKAKVRAAWLKFNPDKDESEMPESIRKTGVDAMTEQEIATLKALAEMTDAQKSHYQSLTTDAAKDEFVKASTTEREAIVETIKSADETYTMSTGSVITKSALGADVFAVMKSQDEQISLMKAQQELTTFAKQADETLGSMPGETLAKAAVLKHIGDMPADVKKTLNEMLTAGNTELAKAYDQNATHVVNGSSVAKGTAQEQLDSLVKSHQADNKCSMQDAYSAVLSTVEGAALYDQTQG